MSATPAAAIEPGVGAPALTADAWPTQQLRTAAMDYRLWVGSSRASLGVGWRADTAHRPVHALRPADALSITLGLRYRLIEPSSVYVDPGAWGGRVRDLRLQWTSRSQVSLRLRGGGLSVAYRAQFY